MTNCSLIYVVNANFIFVSPFVVCYLVIDSREAHTCVLLAKLRSTIMQFRTLRYISN